MNAPNIALLLSALSSLSACACSPEADLRSLVDRDLQPPQILSVGSPEPRLVELEFDEAVSFDPEAFVGEPGLTLDGFLCEGNRCSVFLADPAEPGHRYSFRAAAEDANGNRLGFVASFQGCNPELPRLLINEFITQGSSTHPDLVEIRVLSDGNLAGAVFFDGDALDFGLSFVFPSVRVRAGEYLLIHCKPAGIPEEVDEIDSVDASGGSDAVVTARDFWLRGGTGLSGNNGLLTLYASPEGALLDAVPYSTRTAESDEDYGGFGNRALLERIERITELGGWVFPSGTPRPEDCVQPGESTSTRSISRSSGAEDTNSAADWHVTPTRGATFGAMNSDAVYVR